LSVSESGSAIARLKSDHRVIEGVLESVETMADEITQGHVPVEALKRAVEFSQTFVDRCHHGKKELCLFPCLEKRGIPREGGPIGVMLHEHEVGRDLVKRIQDALGEYERERTDGNELRRLCLEYAAHLRRHISKEEYMLILMGETVMNREDHRGSTSCYERTVEERIGKRKHQEMLRLAEEMGSLAPP
jgi:hemerythrin-like domain-containing protein